MKPQQPTEGEKPVEPTSKSQASAGDAKTTEAGAKDGDKMDQTE
jgi:hypothetical protein